MKLTCQTAAGRVRDGGFHIDEKESMVQIAVTVENLSAAGDDELANQVQKRMREVFGLRIQIEIGESGSLPAFEMKAKRWNVSI